MSARAFSVVLACALPAFAQEREYPPPRDPDAEIVPRRAGPSEPQRYVPPLPDRERATPPDALAPRETLPVPDRWRIMQALGLKSPWFDPYNQNVLKGDLPIASEPWFRDRFPDLAGKLGNEWFLNLGAISDSLVEARRLPTPVGAQTTQRPGSVDVFGYGKQSTLAETLIVSMSLIKGDTTFRPPDYEFRFTPAFNVNRSEVDEVRALRIDPREGTARNDSHAAIQELFADVHLRNVSPRYDFDSIRVGIQPFNADFRGFLFQDQPLGVRLFGTRDNNQWQYNLAWFRRLEKDTNSGLNDLGAALRDDDVFVANLYRQDFPFLGFTSQVTVVANVNREGDGQHYDSNGFLVRPAVVGDSRPHDYRVTYLGYSGDGHIAAGGISPARSTSRSGHDDAWRTRSRSARSRFARDSPRRSFRAISAGRACA